MDFTREPIIETIVTAKEGYNLVVRSSKSTGQDEYFVEAVEIVSFGGALFFRSQEKSKAFLVPVSDYEVVEVREARMVLKNAVIERNVKIGGGKEGSTKQGKEKESDKESEKEEKVAREESVQVAGESESSQVKSETKIDKKKERRRHYRRKRGREDKEDLKDENETASESNQENNESTPQDIRKEQESALPNPVVLSALLQPPSELISQTIRRYRENDTFKGVFFLNEEDHYKPHDKVQELLDDEEESISFASSDVEEGSMHSMTDPEQREQLQLVDSFSGDITASPALPPIPPHADFESFEEDEDFVRRMSHSSDEMDQPE